MRCEGGMVHGQKDTRRTQQNGLRLMKNYYLKKKCNRRKKLWNYKMRWSEILSERVWTAYLIYTVGNTFVIIIINLIHNLEFDLSKTCIENHTFFYFFSAKCYSIYSMMIWRYQQIVCISEIFFWSGPLYSSEIIYLIIQTLSANSIP